MVKRTKINLLTINEKNFFPKKMLLRDYQPPSGSYVRGGCTSGCVGGVVSGESGEHIFTLLSLKFGKNAYPLDTGRRLNVLNQKTSWASSERLMYVQFTSCVYGVAITG